MKTVMRHSFHHPIPIIRIATSAQLMQASARHNALNGGRLHGASALRHVPLSNDLASLPEDS
jgi:hypothetical protein